MGSDISKYSYDFETGFVLERLGEKDAADVVAPAHIRLHEGFHWMQHHGTSWGAFITLVRYSLEATALDYFPKMPKSIRADCVKRKLDGKPVIPLDGRSDYPASNNDDVWPGILFRMLHDNFLVYNLFLFSNKELFRIDWPMLTVVNEIFSDVLIQCCALGLIQYPGHEIARTRILGPCYDKPLNPSLWDGIENASIVELSATINDLWIENGMHGRRSSDFWQRLFDGTPKKAMRSFETRVGSEPESIEQWLETIAIICDLSLNPPLPPWHIDPDVQYEWSEIFPPFRFVRLADAVRVIGRYDSCVFTYSQYVDRLCECSHFLSPLKFNKTDSKYFKTADYSDVNVAIKHLFSDNYCYLDYYRWVQKNMIALRSRDPLAFSDLGKSVSGDKAAGRMSWIVGSSGMRWSKPQVTWIDDEDSSLGRLGFEVNEHDEQEKCGSQYGSGIAISRCRYLYVYDFFFKNEAWCHYPEDAFRALLDTALWFNRRMGIVDRQWVQDLSSGDRLISVLGNSLDTFFVSYHVVLPVDPTERLEFPYALVKTYSTVIPDGDCEILDLRQDVLPVSDSIFDKAKSSGWRLSVGDLFSQLVRTAIWYKIG